MMNGQAANKQGSGKVLWVFVGIALFGVGCYYESTTFVIAGIICVILAFVGKKKNNAVSTEIKSGATQNMPANMTVTAASTIRSGSLNARATAIVQNADTDLINKFIRSGKEKLRL